jgi:gliding motility-associated-like protein
MKQFILPFVFICFCFQNISAHNGPVAVNDTVSVPENRAALIAVTANDIDSNGGELTVTIATPAQHGVTTVQNLDAVLYTPVQSYFGPDSFSYTVCDTFNLCSTAKVYLTVLGSNTAPYAGNDTYTFGDTVSSIVLNVLVNDSDANHDSIFVGGVINYDSSGTLGRLSFDSSNGTVIFTRNTFGCGSENFEYIVCNFGKCDTGIVTVNVTCPDSFFLPAGISPNEDGKNDFLVFPNLDYFTPATLQVFNRYGIVVYKNTSYDNSWGGTDGDTGRPLPDGTYYYTLQLSNGKTYNNYLIINR